jgi:segregation and condensation protein A
MLLPQAAVPETEDADPRRELVKQLVEYKKFKEAAARLEERADANRRRLPRLFVPEAAAAAGPPPVKAVELWDLVSAFGRILSETQSLQPSEIVADDTPQHVYLEQARLALAASDRVRFRDLFMPPYQRERLAGLFLAVLELIRQGEATLEQDELFGEIWLKALSAQDSGFEPEIANPGGIDG